MNKYLVTIILVLTVLATNIYAQQRKAVFVILDGICADVVEKLETPVMKEIASRGGYTRAYLGGIKGGYSESPTISAVGYNHLLTGVWTNKHNVWDNDIKDPNYNYYNIFRIVEEAKPGLKTAVFSTWQDNRTKLVGEGLQQAGNIKLDYSFDGFELDEKKFPHNDDKYIFNIDEHVSTEAGRYIAENGPDLSWVYLEFTDDMGHAYGDSPQYYDAIKKADAQVGRVWNAIKKREKENNEQWLIVITTDHGRDAATGKNHGGQSERERTTWITTNAKDLNAHFKQTPATVDIMPSILKFLNIEMPAKVKAEADGVSFIGKVSVSNLKAKRNGDTIELTWDVIDKQGDAEILVANTNNFKTGGEDIYANAGKVKVSAGKFSFKAKAGENFYKIRLKAPLNELNVWVTQ